MQNFIVNLECKGSDSFYANKASNSVNLDITTKLKHTLEIVADIKSEYSIGLIVGSSGSGKSTLSQKMFGADCLKETLDGSTAVIDQFFRRYDL